MTPSLRVHNYHVVGLKVGGLLFTPQSLSQMVCLLSLIYYYNARVNMHTDYIHVHIYIYIYVIMDAKISHL